MQKVYFIARVIQGEFLPQVTIRLHSDSASQDNTSENRESNQTHYTDKIDYPRAAPSKLR